MEYALPARWKGKPCVEWDLQNPSVEWLNRFWAFYSNYRTSASRELFAQWPLIPSRDGKLHALMCSKNVINMPTQLPLASVLIRAGCYLFNGAILDTHAKAAEELCSKSDGVGVCDALQAVRASNLPFTDQEAAVSAIIYNL